MDSSGLPKYSEDGPEEPEAAEEPPEQENNDAPEQETVEVQQTTPQPDEDEECVGPCAQLYADTLEIISRYRTNALVWLPPQTICERDPACTPGESASERAVNTVRTKIFSDTICWGDPACDPPEFGQVNASGPISSDLLELKRNLCGGDPACDPPEVEAFDKGGTIAPDMPDPLLSERFELTSQPNIGHLISGTSIPAQSIVAIPRIPRLPIAPPITLPTSVGQASRWQNTNQGKSFPGVPGNSSTPLGLGNLGLIGDDRPRHPCTGDAECLRKICDSDYWTLHMGLARIPQPSRKQFPGAGAQVFHPPYKTLSIDEFQSFLLYAGAQGWNEAEIVVGRFVVALEGKRPDDLCLFNRLVEDARNAYAAYVKEANAKRPSSEVVDFVALRDWVVVETDHHLIIGPLTGVKLRLLAAGVPQGRVDELFAVSPIPSLDALEPSTENTPPPKMNEDETVQVPEEQNDAPVKNSKPTVTFHQGAPARLGPLNVLNELEDILLSPEITTLDSLREQK